MEKISLKDVPPLKVSKPLENILIYTLLYLISLINFDTVYFFRTDIRKIFACYLPQLWQCFVQNKAIFHNP